MFSLFKSPVSQQDLQKRAKEAYERVVGLTADTMEARSMRRGMSLLCCAHFDKSFISGAERMADWQQMAAFAAAKGQDVPPLPKADCYQKIRSGQSDIWVYLPPEYSDGAFACGAKYQKTELTMEGAINAMQQLADQFFRFELGIDGSLLVLKFLRQELTSAEKLSDVPEDLSGMPFE